MMDFSDSYNYYALRCPYCGAYVEQSVKDACTCSACKNVWSDDDRRDAVHKGSWIRISKVKYKNDCLPSVFKADILDNPPPPARHHIDLNKNGELVNQDGELI